MKKALLLNFVILFTSVCFAAKVDTIQVESKAMHKTICNIVVLPDSYQATKAYPTVYLLHGAYGDHTDWVQKAQGVKQLSDLYQVIIVCPNGGYNSWYFDSPVDSTFKYETFVSKELPEFVESHYSTIKDKSGRAITGLSMGGHGALYLAIRHQDFYGAAGSMSGGVDIRPFPNEWDIAKRLGAMDQNPQIWNDNTVISNIELLKGSSLKLIFDCGINDFFHDVNVDLHHQLLKMNYPHDYIERPGVHNWPYWSNAVKYQFLFFYEFFNKSKNGK